MKVDAFGQSLCKGKNSFRVSLNLFCTISIQTKASTLENTLILFMSRQIHIQVKSTYLNPLFKQVFCCKHISFNLLLIKRLMAAHLVHLTRGKSRR